MTPNPRLTTEAFAGLGAPDLVYVREMLADFGILQSDGSFKETDLVYAPESRLLYQDSAYVQSALPQQLPP